MEYPSITSVSPERSAVDRLRMTMRFRPDFWGTEPRSRLIVDLIGEVVFYREPYAANTMPAPATPRMSLPVRWQSRERVARMDTMTNYELSLVCDLPGDAVERIDTFRESGPLYLRVEGEVMALQDGVNEIEVLTPGPNGRPSTRHLPLLSMTSQLQQLGARVWASVRTTPYPLEREAWSAGVLRALRPPGRVLVEIALPREPVGADEARDVLQYIEKAQGAFDAGRWDEVARLIYVALEKLQRFTHTVEARYGPELKAPLSQQLSKTLSVCNPERHAQAAERVDRVLAQHLLISGRSLTAVYLQGA